MAKQKIKQKKETDHTSYCAGKDWTGDGTKSTSPCPFKHAKVINTVRYKCYACAIGLLPESVYADSKGIYRSTFTGDVLKKRNKETDS